MKLDGKIALVTGGKRIGVSVAISLAEAGCAVALTYHRSRKEAESTARTIQRLGKQALVVRTDITKESEIRALIKKTIGFFGRLDIVVHMASVYESVTWKNLDRRAWERHLDANLTSGFLIGTTAAPYLRRTKGRLIHVSDWVAASGRPRYRHYLPYYTAKKGIIGLTEAQALELAPEVLVNAIAPGPIIPPKGASRREINKVRSQTPLGRWGDPVEIAKAVRFFCETDFVTGECLRVDGGRHLF